MSEFNEVVKSGARTIGKRIKKIILWTLLIAIIGTGAYIGACNITYSKGTRSGLLNKVSYKGVVWKTYEGELNMGSISTRNENGIIGNTWEFSVWKDDIYDQLQDYQGQPVKLYYRQKFKAMPWQGKTDYFIYKVELVKSVQEDNQ
jgi:hypothetical protein